MGVGVKVTFLSNNSNVYSIQHYSNKHEQGKGALCFHHRTQQVVQLYGIQSYLDIPSVCWTDTGLPLSCSIAQVHAAGSSLQDVVGLPIVGKHQKMYLWFQAAK